jgi:RsiW-degrading membrane proteinase PrsW (M82 family)
MKAPNGPPGLGGQFQPGGQLKNRLDDDSATKSEMFPVFAKRKDLVKKGLIIPAATVFLFGMILTAEVGNPTAFRNVLGVFIGLACFYAIYSLCGKKKAWYILVGATLFTIILMISPVWNLLYILFYKTIGTPSGPAFDQMSFPRQVIGRFFSTGLLEEFVKIIPVLILWRLTSRLKPANKDRIGVTEPLDGILVGAASALGFVLVETLGQYAPQAVMSAAIALHKNLPQLPADVAVLAGSVFGLESVIMRIVPELSGHLAYSGYFGYFVGLAALKPKHGWKLVLTGWACAAGLHATWDLFCDRPGFLLFQLPMMIVFYAFLVAAILKARQISPTRAQNFATVVINSPGVAALQQPVAQPQPAPQPEMRRAPAPSAPPRQYAPPQPAPQPRVVAQPQPQYGYAAAAAPRLAPDPNGFRLLVAQKALALRDGQRFSGSDIPGLRAAAADGVVAAVSRNPKDPTMMGLQNLSSTTWKATLPGGEMREIASGRSVRLLAATRIDFGLVQGEVA